VVVRFVLEVAAMQHYLASVFAQVAEFGVFFAAAAALTAGALALR
jgi:hypothetical protein